MRHTLQTHRFVAFSPSEKAKSHSWKPTRRRCARNFTRTQKAQKSLPKIKILTRKKNAQPEISEEEMRATFDNWDKDGDGLTYCTSKELYVHRISITLPEILSRFGKGDLETPGLSVLKAHDLAVQIISLQNFRKIFWYKAIQSFISLY